MEKEISVPLPESGDKVSAHGRWQGDGPGALVRTQPSPEVLDSPGGPDTAGLLTMKAPSLIYPGSLAPRLENSVPLAK